MSRIIAVIDEKLINAVLAKAGPIEGEEHKKAEPVTVPYIGIRSKETPFGIKIPFPCRKEKSVIPWKITLKWYINNLRVKIHEDTAMFKADVHAKSGAFRYTEPVQGAFTVAIIKTTLLVTLQSVKVTLHIKPKTTRINILTFDIVDKLPPELRQMKFDLPFNSNLDIPLPGGETLSLFAKDTDITLKNGCIEVSSNLETLQF
jgi:hypothetical protein